METYLAETKQRVPAKIFNHKDYNILTTPVSKKGFIYNFTIRKVKDTIEITEYSRPLVRNLTAKKTAQRSHIYTDKPYKRRLDNIYRARNRSRLDLLGHFPKTPIAQQSPAFITLTLDATHEHQKSDIKWFMKEMYKFIRRARALKLNLQFKFSLEWQDGKRLTYWDKLAGKKPRMALHAHMLCTNWPYLPGDYNQALRKLWPNGNIFVDRIGTSNEDRLRVAHYLTKYLTKDAVTAKIKYAKMVWTSENFEQHYMWRNPTITPYLAMKMDGKYYAVYVGKLNPMYKMTAQDEINKLAGWTPIYARKTILLPIPPT
jgi:hypothetical protein